MAYNKRNWVNDETDLSAENMNHIENGIADSYNVPLLAVSDTAPSECSEGDKYYNTETGLIYTATDTDTWGTVGEEPIEDILYVVFSEKNTYAWNGTDMLSVGGGSGSEIVIGDEEPTEDTKMIIDTDAFDPQYSDITDEYSEANNKAYSCDYINGTVLYNNTTGSNNTITLSDSVSNYKSIEITYKCNTYGYKTMKIDTPNGKTIILDYNVVANENINQFAGSTFRAINNQLIYNNSCILNVTLAGAITTQQDAKLITIVKVIGYNKVGE